MKRFLILIPIFLFGMAIRVYGVDPKAIDLEVRQGESSVYILYDDGVLNTAGNAVNFGYPSRINAVDLTLTSTGQGYYILDRDGAVYAFGDAVQFGQPVSSRVNVVDMELSRQDGFYFLRQDGSIVTVGGAVYYGAFLKANAVDLELTQDGKGYYVLYQDGTLAFFGDAVNYGFVTSQTNRAVDLELVQNGYYVLLSNGTVLNFGGALALPVNETPNTPLTAMTLTSRGYRTLNERGEVVTFQRLDNVGAINWFAQSIPRAVAPQQTATPTPIPTPTVRPTATPRAGTPYFNLRQSGFTERMVGRFPTTVTIPDTMNTGQATISTGDTFYVVFSGDPPAPRSIYLFSNQQFRSTNNTGSEFAALVSERGAAVIRGISYGQPGLIVTVQDGTSLLLMLIEGDFGDRSTIRAFRQYQN